MGLLDGIKIGRRAPAISHLLFLRLTNSSILRIRDILTIYEHPSGLIVNFQKSEIMLSRNAQLDLFENIKQVLGVKIVRNHTKYLGLPTVLSRRYSHTFQGLLDKMWSKTSSWKSLTLSQGGKQVLVQSVLSVMPLYWLSCFLLPDKVIKKIHTTINEFWWRQSARRKGVHWIKAHTLRQPREDGGLGFYNFKYLNLAFLSKQCWRLAKNPDLLGSKLLKAKYFPNTNILEALVTARPSHIWRALHKSLPVLRYGCERDSTTGELIWKLNSSGQLDIKSSYKVMPVIFDPEFCTRGEPSDKTKLARFWGFLWNLPIPQKIKLFIWRGYHAGLPSSDWQAISKEKHWRPDVCCKIFVALWFIWHHRNRVVHGYPNLSPVMASRRIDKLHEDFTMKNKSLLPNLNCSSLVWQKPVRNFVKVNSDGS